MAVRFETEWHVASGQWYRRYGVQVYQYDDAGYTERRFASHNDIGLENPRQPVIDDPFNHVQPDQPVLLVYAQADHHNHKDTNAPQQFYLD